HAVGVEEKELPQAVCVRDVAVCGHPVRREPLHDLIVVRRVEGQMIHRAGSGRRLRNRNVPPLRVGRVGLPLGDVYAGCVAEIEPVAREAERRPEAFAQAEHVAVEVAGRIDVAGENEKMLQPGERHTRLLFSETTGQVYARARAPVAARTALTEKSGSGYASPPMNPAELRPLERHSNVSCAPRLASLRIRGACHRGYRTGRA